MDKLIFYDTNFLLSEQKAVFNAKENFCISSITLAELENIKTSAYKDEDIKYRAREVVRELEKNESKYATVIFTLDMLDKIKKFNLPNTPDTQIIACAFHLQKTSHKEVVFYTQDLLCKQLASVVGLTVCYGAEDIDEYKGFKEIKLTDEELCEFYSDTVFHHINKYDLLENEYLIIRNVHGDVVDKFKWRNGGYEQIQYQKAESKMFGKVTPKNGDIYQQIALDCLYNNRLTVLRGPAGSGKSYLAFAYLFSLLERNKISKIIIFCNTVATKGSAKLGLIIG